MDVYDHLSGRSGLPRHEIEQIALEVNVNQARLNSCHGHVWHPRRGSPMLGPVPRQFVCSACQGSQTSQWVSAYLKGRMHEGGATDLLAQAVAREPVIQTPLVPG